MPDIIGISIPIRVQLVSLGCSKNRVDSERLLAAISSGGAEIIPEAIPYKKSKPDVVIINTCGFIQSAKEESLDEIFRAVEAKNRGYVKRVVVCGCLSQRYKAELRELIPEADALFGTSCLREVLSWLGIKAPRRCSVERLLTTPPHYAYLKIADGCNRRCSYCAIPLIKGGYKSESEENLIAEAKRLATGGVKELILIAQDTTYYGMDLYGKRTLGRLLTQLSDVPGIEWIRLHYSYPLAFPKDVLDVIASNPKVCKYLDIPLQHSSTKVLKMMRRGIDAAGTQKIIDYIRERVPDIALRTTLMVGHPGEGRAEFEELLRFVKRNRFEMMGAFTYSCEEGTYDALHYKDSVSKRVKESRYNRLMALQSAISLEINRKRVGTTERVIIDECRGNYFIGRSMKESPEVDGQIIINRQPSTPLFEYNSLIGKFATVRVTGAREYDIEGDLISVEK